MTAWGPTLGWVALLFVLSRLTSIPEPLHPLAVLPDKVIHVLLYTGLGAALAWGRSRTRLRLPHLALVALGSLYGALDEWHQRFVPGRSAEVGDWAADTVGVAVGYALMMLAFRRRGTRDMGKTPRGTRMSQHG